jgi:hypothetical protein
MIELNKEMTTENAIVTQADKSKTTVIINSKGYSENYIPSSSQ